MREYAEKSLEELRIEDYAANRKGPQAGSSTGLFGATHSSVFGAPQTSMPQQGFSFGQTAQPAQPLFGASSMGTTTTGFGANNNSAFS